MSEDPTMKAFFSGKYKEEIKEEIAEATYDDIGHEINVNGHQTGSYNEYSKLKPESKMYLTNTKIEKMDTERIDLSVLTVDSLVEGETNKFKSGEIPKLLVMYKNIIHNKELTVEWIKLTGSKKNVEETVELTNYFNIPSAHSQGNNWWDSYGVLFIGPRLASKGNYVVNIKSKDNRLTSDKVKSSDNLDVVKFVVE